MAHKLPPNLIKSRHGIFYFRIVFPARLSPARKELRISLKTHSIHTAKHKTNLLRLAYTSFISNIKSMSIKDISNIKDWLKSLSDSWDENGDKLVLRGLKLFDLEIEEVETFGEEDSRHFAEMAENLTKGRRNKLQTERDYPFLKETVLAYLDFLTQKGQRVRKKTEDDYRAKLEAFVEIVGDMETIELSEPHIIEYRKVLENLPPNRTKKSEFKDLSLKEASKINKGDKISTTTIQNTMTRISTFCNWCIDRRYMDFNPVTAFIPKSDTAKNTARVSFTDNDLKELFGNDEILTFKKKDVTTYAYWSGLIALYTGARLEEICRLRLEDFHLDDDIPYISIEPYFDETFNVELKLKTVNSCRAIPLHPDLKKYGLFDYVKGMKKAGFYKLFPELILARDGFGGRVSKWFKRFRDRHLTDNQSGKKTFHSFRHTIINKLINLDVDEKIIAELIGHTGDNKETLKRVYIDKPELEAIYEALKKVKYPIIEYAPKMKKVSRSLIEYSKEYTIKDPKTLEPSRM